MMSDDINHLFTTILPNQDNFSSLLLRSNASSSLNATHSKMIQDETETHNHHTRQDNMIQFILAFRDQLKELPSQNTKKVLSHSLISF